jgi:hypothetical protein
LSGLYTKLKPKDKWVPYVAILSPIICFAIELAMMHFYSYKMGYEMLLINGLITVIGLWVISVRSNEYKQLKTTKL